MSNSCINMDYHLAGGYLRHLLRAVPRSNALLLAIPWSKNFKFACSLEGFHLQIALNWLKYNLLNNIPHGCPAPLKHVLFGDTLTGLAPNTLVTRGAPICSGFAITSFRCYLWWQWCYWQCSKQQNENKSKEQLYQYKRRISLYRHRYNKK